MLTTLLIALGLNFDTFSVSIVEGASVKKTHIYDSLKVGLIFGMSQSLLTLAGSLLGVGFRSLISNIDHWVAFLLLSLIGLKMIRESGDSENCSEKERPIDIRNLFFLGIATSIDALVIGITLAFVKGQIYLDVLTIGVVTFAISFLGFYLGKDLKKICGNRNKIIGGSILIAIGLKILIEHIFIK